MAAVITVGAVLLFVFATMVGQKMATVLAVGAALVFVFAVLALVRWYFLGPAPKSYRDAQLKVGLQLVGACLLVFVVAELID